MDFKKLLIVCGFGAVLGLAVGLMRGIIQYRHDGWANFIRGVVASALVAVVISLALDSIVLPDTMKAAIIGICAYVADDILVSVTTIATNIRNDPTSFLSRWFPWLTKTKEKDVS